MANNPEAAPALEASSVSDSSDSDAATGPCTTSGQIDCVPCSYQATGLCTSTEALFVQRDIAKGLASPDGEAKNSCYSCLVNSGCLDDTTFMDIGNECGDLVGTMDAGARAGTAESALCLDTLGCLLATQCWQVANTACYCGSTNDLCGLEGGAPPTGSCARQEADGLGVPLADTYGVLANYTNATKPAGVANTIIQCARALCAVCQH